ncbi:DUF6470 family protein [Bacillus sp. V5-8f]|uniref:DUF6470 family protein n=1 Tax=Bacillus sp. V5-8f TaxID=2053044 RepID=UPI000C79370A|nr:DUF6470 family protein [Bacillus sp. V5-8f]PLT35707.1 hypothetical protein CUU64_00035 [Bacillus sp. V5-8f]
MISPQIRLQSQFALIDIKTTKEHLSIQQSPADVYIEQPSAEITIERSPSRLTIDQTKAREDVDLKSAKRRIEEYSQSGYSGWLEGVARRVQDGAELMKIENGGNVMAAQAKRNSQETQQQVNIGFVPSYKSVTIDYNPGKLDINVRVNKPNINIKANTPQISYTPSQVQFGVRQYQSLKISFENMTTGSSHELYL